MERIAPDWTSLPRDLLTSIAKRLKRIDILRFRAVCRSFRSSIPRPPKVLFPQSILRTTDFLRGPNPSDDDLFFLVESSIYAIEPLNKISHTHKEETSRKWLVQVEESSPGKVRIGDPLSALRFENLSEKLPKFLNLLDYRVMEITKSYTLESAAIRKGKAKVDSPLKPMKFPVRAKVIFSSFIDECDDGFAVMARFGMRNLYMWRNIDKKWCNIDLGIKQLEYIEDFIYHNHKFYALCSSGRTVNVDSKSLTVTEVAGPKEDMENSLLYLVESLEDLFLVADYGEYEYDRIHYYFKVFKLDEEKHEWFLVVDELELEDIEFFVGRSSFSVSTKEFSGCKGNCVYFLDDDDDRPGEEVIIFDLKDHTAYKISDFLGCSNFFWPPPSWLKQI